MVEASFDPGKETYINLCTYRKDGREVRTPVWVAQMGRQYYVFSEARAGKIKRIRNNGRVSVAACDARGKVRSEWVAGQAQIVTNAHEIQTMYQAFTDKYGWLMRITNGLSRLTGRYQKRAIIAFTLQ